MVEGKSILCVAFTPALQRTLTFDIVERGAVNRATSVTLSAAGKGVNVAVVLRTLGSNPTLTGFLGGDSGRFIEDQLTAQGVCGEWVHVSQPTRHCHTLVERTSHCVTELVEESAAPTSAEWDQMFEKLTASLGSASYMSLSGALPPGAPDDLYTKALRQADAKGVTTVIDSQGGPLMESLKERPLLAKLTTDELVNTCNTGGETGMKILHEHGARHVLVTNGAEPAVFFDGHKFLRCRPPRIEPVNPIGSGDAATAGILHALHRGEAIREAIRLGMACGAANALTARPGQVRAEDVERLVAEVVCEEA